MLHYRELPPSPAFADRIECFWTMRLDGAARVHRVVPDGCADVLLTIQSGTARLDSVGPMTIWRDHTVQPGRELFGVRFHPGRSPLPPIPDSILDLEDVWGSSACRLLDRLTDTVSPHDRVVVVESILPPESPDPVTRAIARLGRVPLDDLARAANLSPRQFRRRCEALTGYTPKLLARILRFRRAAARLQAGAPAAMVATDCGYFDQSHLLRDLRAFRGVTKNLLSP
jgi:AraC-like DNA-binding protein